MFKRLDKLVLDELDKNITTTSFAANRNRTLLLIEILGKRANYRSQAEIAELVQLVSELQFFKERSELKEAELRELVQAFSLIEIKQGQNIINYGEPGENFYVILRGKCGVQIPNPVIKGWREHREKYQDLLAWQ